MTPHNFSLAELFGRRSPCHSEIGHQLGEPSRLESCYVNYMDFSSEVHVINMYDNILVILVFSHYQIFNQCNYKLRNNLSTYKITD